ncbi:unnamed protein product [Mycena citricolor]|uniref:Uncharacterized protein n=1 Tax=Mycena citricolor TaxID=2018698 RepID=A0AAD2HV94_9AGAR|nr:unnamed protein product [Mycena citricolor]CAK5282884.1 unnamed protein product [Mycena citricolor]
MVIILRDGGGKDWILTIHTHLLARTRCRTRFLLPRVLTLDSSVPQTESRLSFNANTFLQTVCTIRCYIHGCLIAQECSISTFHPRARRMEHERGPKHMDGTHLRFVERQRVSFATGCDVEPGEVPRSAASTAVNDKAVGAAGGRDGGRSSGELYARDGPACARGAVVVRVALGDQDAVSGDPRDLVAAGGSVGRSHGRDNGTLTPRR